MLPIKMLNKISVLKVKRPQNFIFKNGISKIFIFYSNLPSRSVLQGCGVARVSRYRAVGRSHVQSDPVPVAVQSEIRIVYGKIRLF